MSSNSKFEIFIFFVYSFCLLQCISCSEGDVIERDIDIVGTLENCANDNDFVFYKIDNMDMKSSLSISFTSTTFELNTISLDTPIFIGLNETSNLFVYRDFQNQIDGSTYFCASIPQRDIAITDELISTSGTIEISYELKEDTPTETIYRRVIVLRNITLAGNEIALRKEFFEFGEDEVRLAK